MGLPGGGGRLRQSAIRLARAGRHGIPINDSTKATGHHGWYHVGSITASPPARATPHEDAGQSP
jgi:hypothetical protein